MNDKQTRWQAAAPVADLATTGTAAGTATWASSGQHVAQTAKDWIGTNGDLLGLAVVLAVIAVAGYIAVQAYLRRPSAMPALLPREPEHGGSRFDQLLAEIQGLSLRIQGGDSKHYFRKIEQLSRIYLERTGCTGAARMTETELDSLLKNRPDRTATGRRPPRDYRTGPARVPEREPAAGVHGQRFAK